MWPFRKRLDLRQYGFTQDAQGNPAFDFTEEEQHEIDGMFQMFRNLAIHKDYVDVVKRATVARALSQYARGLIGMCEYESDASTRRQNVEKAVSAAFKACNVYPLPIFDYDLARYLELAGEGARANELFTKFLGAQATFNPSQIDQMFLKERDVQAAMNYATSKVGQP